MCGFLRDVVGIVVFNARAMGIVMLTMLYGLFHVMGWLAFGLIGAPLLFAAGAGAVCAILAILVLIFSHSPADTSHAWGLLYYSLLWMIPFIVYLFGCLFGFNTAKDIINLAVQRLKVGGS